MGLKLIQGNGSDETKHEPGPRSSPDAQSGAPSATCYCLVNQNIHLFITWAPDLDIIFLRLKAFSSEAKAGVISDSSPGYFLQLEVDFLALACCQKAESDFIQGTSSVSSLILLLWNLSHPP